VVIAVGMVAGCAVVCVTVCVVGVCVVAVVAVCVGVVAAVGGGSGGAVSVWRWKGRHGGEDGDAMDASMADESAIRTAMAATTTYRRLTMDEITLGRKIGEGAYGSVYLGTWQNTPVAIKVMQTASMNEQALKEFSHEATMMAKVSHHPNVLQFLGAVVSSDKLCIVTRFCKKGSLDSALRKEKMDWGLKYRIARDAAAGLAFLHHEGMVHRDIAARNILLGETYQAYISDLGLSRLFEHAEASAMGMQTKSNVGPVRWMAPEAMTQRIYSTATDAYSFGILLWEISSDGQTPYPQLASLADVAMQVIQQGLRPMVPASCGPEWAQLMRQLWSTDPSERLSMKNVFESLSMLVREEPAQSNSESSASRTRDYTLVEMQ
jgi:serine/threonine protein kinase